MYAAAMSRVIAVRQEPARTTVVLKSFRAWEALAPLSGMLAGMVIYLSVRDPHGDLLKSLSHQARAVEGLIALGAAAVGAAVIGFLAQFLGGCQEIVVASPQRLVIEREVLRRPRWWKRWTFDAPGVRNVRAYVHETAQKKGRFPPWLVSLAFDHDGKMVSFGAGLVGADADRVVRALVETMKEPSR
jgi:hypothetical protein